MRARLWLLARHVRRLHLGGQIRFRLETFGVYYPTAQYAAPWWRVSLPGLALLLRRTGAYASWVEEMDAVARGGGTSWWAARSGPGVAAGDPIGERLEKPASMWELS